MAVADTDKTRDSLAKLRIPRGDDRRRPASSSRGLQLVIVLLLLAILLVIGAVAAQQLGLVALTAEWIPEAIRARTEVRAAKVVVETGRAGDAVVVATGYLESYRQANIGARAAGRIETVNVEEGSRVEKGDVIAVLDHKDIEAALAGARASLLRAKAELEEQEVAIARFQKDLDRIGKLRKTNAASEAEYDQSFFQHRAAVAKLATQKAAVAQAEARVQESEQFKENMIVRAPFSGTVISKDAEVGESILPGGMGEASGRGSVVTIADLERLEVDCDVKEDYIGRVKNGSPAEVAVDAVPDRKYSARVRKVIPMGDRARATIKVKVAILDADERLFPEMSARVYFLPEPDEQPQETKERRIFVESTAVVTSGSDSFVWEIDGGLRLQKTSVSTGLDRDGRTEILSGLNGGERVVVRPTDQLQSGQLVKLRD
jgi:RND family efflux transporter MFP subunit